MINLFKNINFKKINHVSAVFMNSLKNLASYNTSFILLFWLHKLIKNYFSISVLINTNECKS